jgi:hypothetical protein
VPREIHIPGLGDDGGSSNGRDNASTNGGGDEIGEGRENVESYSNVDRGEEDGGAKAGGRRAVSRSPSPEILSRKELERRRAVQDNEKEKKRRDDAEAGVAAAAAGDESEPVRARTYVCAGSLLFLFLSL